MTHHIDDCRTLASLNLYCLQRSGVRAAAGTVAGELRQNQQIYYCTKSKMYPKQAWLAVGLARCSTKG
eukprot:2533851-Pleurochrysis_carterae.AAC.1